MEKESPMARANFLVLTSVILFVVLNAMTSSLGQIV